MTKPVVLPRPAVAIAIGYVIASAVLTFKDLGFQAEIDFFYIGQNYRIIGAVRPDDFRLINLIMGGAGVAGLMLSLAMSGSALTRFGLTHWQTRREMKRNGDPRRDGRTVAAARPSRRSAVRDVRILVRGGTIDKIHDTGAEVVTFAPDSITHIPELLRIERCHFPGGRASDAEGQPALR